MMQKSVNRQLPDLIMDNLDHALGRPVDPLLETHRSHFECRDEDEAKFFEKTGYWSRDGDFCRVNRAGRVALKRYLIDTFGEPA